MALSPLLDLRQSQSLVMTPQLMQSIKLLQMTTLELERFLDAELEKNPLLEREDFDAPASKTEASQDPTHLNDYMRNSDFANTQLQNAHAENTESQNTEAQNIIPQHDDASLLPLPLSANDGDNQQIQQLFAIEDTFDTGLDNVFPDDHLQTLPQPSIKPRDWDDIPIKPLSFDAVGIENIATEKQSLRQSIAEQIMFLSLSEQERFIAFDLADQLDETGYFSGNLEETAIRLNLNSQAIIDVFEQLQQFDPPGIFATSLRDCLALQLKRKNRYDPAIEIVLENLTALAKRNFAYLAKITHLDISELVEILKEIQELNPKPGLEFSCESDNFIIPDIIIHKSNDGTYQAELNMAVLPKLIMHHDYSLKICANAAERGFIGECLQNAHWLLRALDQRAKTLLKVSSEIMRHQEDFLNLGIGYLKPLNLAMIADAVGMHESTISRVTANKYVATPRGTFEMRSFFSVALQSTHNGESHAADAVRHRIRQLIDAEDVNAILSDDKLVEVLKKEKIDIARRTVAKYRESMNISSSVARRREKKARFDATKS